MAFANNSGSIGGNEGYGMGLVRSSSFGRKRVVCMEFRENGEDRAPTTPSKRQCIRDEEKSVLEAMPQEILIRILCGVDHDDLKRLIFVSKAIRNATLIAKQSHFAYSTPRKTLKFKNVCDFDDFAEIEAPNAPKQSRFRRSKLSAKKLAGISISLFGSDDLIAKSES